MFDLVVKRNEQSRNANHDREHPDRRVMCQMRDVWMKQKIDELLAMNEKLQRFLEWVDKKTRAIEGFHKLVGIRAFYFRIEVDDLSLPIFWEFSPDIEKFYCI